MTPQETSTSNTQNEITLKISPDWTTFLNVNRYYSMSSIHFFFITGGRGIGKTTGFNIHNVQDFIKNGNEFVYCRRYKSELDKTKTMFDPIVNSVKHAPISKGLFQWEVNKVRLGYGLCLSLQQLYKSGVDFSRVNTLIYDEAILRRGGARRYLPNEVEDLFELCSTIFRERTDYRVFVLGNNADIFSPFTEYFGIPIFEKYYVDNERGLYFELSRNSPALIEKEKETPLYKLVKGTQYADYHYNNKVLLNVAGKLGVKSPHARLMCRFVINTITLNVYRQSLREVFIELREKVIKDELTYVITEGEKPNYMYIKSLKTSDLYKFVSAAYYTDCVIYNSNKCATLFSQVIDMI